MENARSSRSHSPAAVSSPRPELHQDADGAHISFANSDSMVALCQRPTQMGTTRLPLRVAGEMRQADAPLTRVCRTGMADRAKAKMTVAPNTCIRRLAMTGGE